MSALLTLASGAGLLAPINRPSLGCQHAFTDQHVSVTDHRRGRRLAPAQSVMLASICSRIRCPHCSAATQCLRRMIAASSHRRNNSLPKP